MSEPESSVPAWRWGLSVASFLLGLFAAVLWWRKQSDERLLDQMEKATEEGSAN
ncbi:MAG: hypothetical protein ACRDIB_08965 [Ardenticatenaceae bacterium]